MLPSLTLVIGGAAAGKSRFAEGLVCIDGRQRVYLATAQAFDAEMSDRITRHRQERGPDWVTFEEPLAPWEVLRARGPSQIVLLDCATLWLSNVILANHDWETSADLLEAGLDNCPCPVVIVSNEVGQGIVPATPLGRAFRDAQGRLNQRLAARAGLVLQVVAGLPLVLKGTLPEAST
ncbi:MAG: bifunctional adenosylcobinamide kinase/adenosylcobinamide-phosphate guanylyltransferase [Rhodobacteraceae bacterium]|nr:bifunctional adenosylcobinamide kinase/adenosylcobinamide-phosphate guanylyltransferase [Paracoccaceae bacterium]